MSRRLFLCLLLMLLVASESLAEAPQVRFRLRSLSGERFDSQQAQGPMILSFFFTRCPPCLEEMPALLRKVTSLPTPVHLLFVNPYVPELGITEAPDTERSIRRFAQQLGIPESVVYFDELGSVTRRFTRAHLFPQAQAYGTLLLFPSLVVLKADGTVQWVQEGSAPDFLEQLEAAL